MKFLPPQGGIQANKPSPISRKRRPLEAPSPEWPRPPQRSATQATQQLPARPPRTYAGSRAGSSPTPHPWWPTARTRPRPRSLARLRPAQPSSSLARPNQLWTAPSCSHSLQRDPHFHPGTAPSGQWQGSRRPPASSSRSPSSTLRPQTTIGGNRGRGPPPGDRD